MTSHFLSDNNSIIIINSFLCLSAYYKARCCAYVVHIMFIIHSVLLLFSFFNVLLFMLLEFSPIFPPSAPSAPPIPDFHSQSPHHCLYLWVFHICFLINPFTFFQTLPTSLLPSYSYQSVPWFYASGSILLISLFCSLHSSYKWDHMVFVFHQLAYFT